MNETYLRENSIEEIEILCCNESVEDSDVDYQTINPGDDLLDVCVEADEMWNYVGKKSNPVWLWYAIDKKTRVVLAFVFGKRNDETGKKLCELLREILVNRIWTDGWSTYEKYLPEDQHCISKTETQRIERKNLTLRTHIKRLTRKTICFSKSEVMHQTVIGLYINKYHFLAA